jgi:hypothetical protein
MTQTEKKHCKQPDLTACSREKKQPEPETTLWPDMTSAVSLNPARARHSEHGVATDASDDGLTARKQ